MDDLPDYIKHILPPKGAKLEFYWVTGPAPVKVCEFIGGWMIEWSRNDLSAGPCTRCGGPTIDIRGCKYCGHAMEG